MPRLPRWEIRILVALPVLFVLVALATSTVGIELAVAALGRGELTAAQSLAIQKVRLALIGLGSVAAAAIGLLLAAAIVRPLREMVRSLRARLEPDAPARARRAVSELSQLSNAFNHMLLSFDKFVTDSHIVEGMPLGVLLVDREGLIKRSNAEARRLLHTDADGLEGRPVSAIGGPTLAAALADAVTRVRESESVEPLEPLSVVEAVAPGVDVTLQVSVFPAEPPDEFLFTLRDLSQVPKIRSQIRRVDELAAVGAHVASLAHEVSGSLMALQTLLDLLGTRAERDEDIKRKLQAEMDRAGRLMEEMRAFGQESLGERTPCQVAELLEEPLWVSQNRFTAKNVEVERHIDPTLPPVFGDADRLRQAFVNVVTNAFEATPLHGTIRVAAAHDAAGIVVRVANTGSYIAPEDRRKIFDLFYTTKKRGTGFGLALARRTIADQGGTIEVLSSEESGTEFVIHLPVQTPESK